MEQSWSLIRKVPEEQLQARLQTVVTLSAPEQQDELYEIVRDMATGEQYVHYAYRHLHVSDGTEESFHQLLPVAQQVVDAIAAGTRAYTYPDNWTTAFLRNGPHGFYIWYDPSGGLDADQPEADKQAQSFLSQLAQWKTQGNYDADSVRQLLEQVETSYRTDETTKKRNGQTE